MKASKMNIEILRNHIRIYIDKFNQNPISFEHLKWYADKILSSETPPKLVVMGHNHQFVVDHNGYSNDGAFCGSENLSCLEVIDDKTAVMARLETERH
ncbi:MAG: hypothetical protein QG577_1521 [Thermodesulfobacteriota bacterium]|nr:hypothetical protein [Thermodesulfobacteriota bacterium]